MAQLEPDADDVRALASTITRYDSKTSGSVFDSDRYTLSREKGVLSNALAATEDELRILQNQYMHLGNTMRELMLVVMELVRTSQRNLGILLSAHAAESADKDDFGARGVDLLMQGEVARKVLFQYLDEINTKWKLGVPASQFTRSVMHPE
jgi:hypothetical protein